MALISEVNFKAAAALAAAQLQIMWRDTVKTEMAVEVKRPSQALRRLDKLWILDPATSGVISNDPYITLAYAGTKEIVGTKTGLIGDIVPVLSTAAVENAAPTLIVLTFDTDISGIENLSIGGVVTTPKVIAGLSVDGNVVTITTDTAYIVTDTISVSGIFRSGNNQVTLAAEVVTNNVT